MKRIGIVGSRSRESQSDWQLVKHAFEAVYKRGDWIVSGGCRRGADAFAKSLHYINAVPYLEFPADWNHHGKAAGFVRNTEIALWSDVLIACVAADRTGGTEDTITKFLTRLRLSEKLAIELSLLVLV